MFEPIQQATSSLVHVGLIVGPVLTFGLIKRSKPIVIASLLTAALYVVQILILVIPNFGPFAALKMNWLQKALACLFVIAAGYVLRFKPEQYGLKFPSKILPALFLAVAVCVGTSVPSSIQAIVDNNRFEFNFEYLLFQASMPGLHEELFYRGLLLCLWDNVSIPNFKFFGVNWGMGALISAALFTMGHTLIFDHSFALSFAPPLEWFDLMFFALAITWLRYKTGSILPGIIAHNLENCGEFFLRCYY